MSRKEKDFWDKVSIGEWQKVPPDLLGFDPGPIEEGLGPVFIVTEVDERTKSISVEILPRREKPKRKQT